MNPRSALSYALSPGANMKMDCSRDELSPADIITALGWAGRGEIVPGFNGLATNLIRAKWAKDGSVLPALHREVVRFSVWHFGRKNWAVYDREKATAAETMSLFAAQVMIEYDDSVCHSCYGRGTVPNETGVSVICPVCKGTQREAVTSSARARSLKMHHESIKDTWGNRFDWIQQELKEIERNIISRVRVHLEEI